MRGRSLLRFATFGFATFGFASLGFASLGFASLGFASLGFASLGFASLGFASLGFATFGFATFGFATFGFATFGFAAFGFNPIGLAAFRFATLGVHALGLPALSVSALGLLFGGLDTRCFLARALLALCFLFRRYTIGFLALGLAACCLDTRGFFLARGFLALRLELHCREPLRLLTLSLLTFGFAASGIRARCFLAGRLLQLRVRLLHRQSRSFLCNVRRIAKHRCSAFGAGSGRFCRDHALWFRRCSRHVGRRGIARCRIVDRR